MSDYSFLDLEQICKSKDKYSDKQLDIMKKYGRQAYASDFAILLGCRVDSKRTINKNGLVRSFGAWWTSSIPLNYESYGHRIYSIGTSGEVDYSYWFYSRDIGGRPTTSFSRIRKACLRPIRIDSGVLEVEYGEYPQSVVCKDFSNELEKNYSEGMLKKTGKQYSVYGWSETNDFVEYEYNGSKYIRFIGDTKKGYEQSIYNCGIDNVQIDKKVLSDGRVVEDGCVYWIKVEPIKWLIDEKKDVALSEDILYAGFSYGHNPYYKDYDMPHNELKKYFFNNTSMKYFLDRHFSNDIISTRCLYIKNKLDEVEENESIKKELLNFYYDNLYNEFFIELNSLNKKDNLVLFMDIILDSDSYFEMNKKLNFLKKAISAYSVGQKRQALNFAKYIASDKNKDIYKGKIVAYPKSSINMIEKPKRIIDRMLDLYLRIDSDSYQFRIDKSHEKARSVSDVCFIINCNKFRKDTKVKIKSLFQKKLIPL